MLNFWYVCVLCTVLVTEHCTRVVCAENMIFAESDVYVNFCESKTVHIGVCGEVTL